MFPKLLALLLLAYCTLFIVAQIDQSVSKSIHPSNDQSLTRSNHLRIPLQRRSLQRKSKSQSSNPSISQSLKPLKDQTKSISSTSNTKQRISATSSSSAIVAPLSSSQTIARPIIQLTTPPVEQLQQSTRHSIKQSIQQSIKQSNNQPSFSYVPSSSASHRAALINHRSIVYTGELNIGGQSFTVVFDTGSSDMWVTSARSITGNSIKRSSSEPVHSEIYPRREQNSYYDYSLSSSYESNGSTWSIEYGEGRASGILSRDTISVAGYTATNVTFGEALEYSANFRGDDVTDGILGLSFASGSESTALPLIDVLYQQGVIEKRMFSFHLSPSPEDDSSVFILGEPVKEYAPRGLNWYPLVDQTNYQSNDQTINQSNNVGNQWLIGVDGVSLGDRRLNLCVDKPCHGLLDTGTSFLGLPVVAFMQVRHVIVMSRSDCKYDLDDGEIECSNPSLEGLPTLTIHLGSRSYQLFPNDYMIEGVVGIMAIEASHDQDEMIIFGDTFGKTFYCVFDMDNKRVGIAEPEMSINQTIMCVGIFTLAALCTLGVGLAIVWNKRHKGYKKLKQSIKQSNNQTNNQSIKQSNNQHVVEIRSSPIYEPLYTSRSATPRTIILSPTLTPRNQSNNQSNNQIKRTFDWSVPLKNVTSH